MRFVVLGWVIKPNISLDITGNVINMNTGFSQMNTDNDSLMRKDIAIEKIGADSGGHYT